MIILPYESQMFKLHYRAYYKCRNGMQYAGYGETRMEAIINLMKQLDSLLK